MNAETAYKRSLMARTKSARRDIRELKYQIRTRSRRGHFTAYHYIDFREDYDTIREYFESKGYTTTAYNTFTGDGPKVVVSWARVKPRKVLL